MHLDPLGEGQFAQLVVNGRREVDGLLNRRRLAAGLGRLRADLLPGLGRKAGGGAKGVTTPLSTVLRCFDMALPLQLRGDPLPEAADLRCSRSCFVELRHAEPGGHGVLMGRPG